MKANRVIFAVVLIGAILLGACGTAATPTTAPAATEAPAMTEAPAVTDAPAVANPDGCLGTADAALVDLNCQEIQIAVENAYLPFNYIMSSTGQPGGWDYDTWNQICTLLHCKPVFVEAAWDGLIQGIANKQYDVAADGITITDDRAQIVDFSKGYLSIEQRLLVRKGETRFASMDDFIKDDSLVLGTQSNTTNYETAVKLMPETRIKAFEQFPFAVQALIGGDVDAVIIDQVAGMGYMGENADKIEFVGPSISSDELGFAFPKGSALVEPVNKAIDAMQASGFLLSVDQKYFGPDFNVTSNDIQQ